MQSNKKVKIEKKELDNQSINSIQATNLNDESTNSSDYLNQLNLKDTNKWMFKLNFDFRDKLIKLINQYTKSFASDKKILINEKQLIENKNDLIKLLTASPFKLDDKSSDVDKIVLNLDNTFKHEIIDQLIKNEHLIIEFKDTIDRNSRIELIKENNNLINKLYQLPIGYANDLILVDDNDKQSDDKDNQSVNCLKTEFSNLKNETINLKKEMNKLKRKLDDEILKNEKLKNQLDDNNSITISCVKKDVKNFFENDNSFVSEPTVFLNIKCCIQINSNLHDNKRYLGVYLLTNNEIDDKNNVKWENKISYKLILKTNLPGQEDFKSNNYISKFNKSIRGLGLNKLISKDDLFNSKNGYVKDDSIRLEIEFKILEVTRNI